MIGMPLHAATEQMTSEEQLAGNGSSHAASDEQQVGADDPWAQAWQQNRCMRCGGPGATGKLVILCEDCKAFLAAADRQTSEDRMEFQRQALQTVAETNSKGGKGSSGSSSSIYESGKGGKGSSGKNKGGKGSSGSIYEIDEHTKVQCTKAEYKIEGDCWTRL